jgi:class 3 adenylate cyclase/tetratricopeptide (TPR) repeat protein
MDVRCPSCGEINPERAKFCLECGTSLASVRGGAEERRTVTVAFADLVGSTALGERLDSESLRRVVDRYYDAMRAAVEAEDGVVAKFIGDAVMAVWGTPAMHEDDALRAVRAAAAMRGALAALNEDLEPRWGVRLGVRIGVNTGEVVVDPQRSADLLVGDALNTAARLEQAAADGEILVGPDTYRLVRGEVALEPVAPLELRGKARPLRVWRLSEGEGPARATSPLIGRERELAVLRAAFDDAVESSSFRLVTVVGSPGVGKTRLADELACTLDGAAKVVVGRCEASGEGATLLPVADVLRGGAEIEEGDPPVAARARLAAIVEDPGVVEILAGVLGLVPPVGVEETFWAVRRFLGALARRRPLVVVLDDLHWAQPTLLDLVEHLAQWGQNAPVLVIAMARPELREARASLAEGALDLQPLAEGESRALVERLLGAATLPDGLAERVLATTEGNPLFLSEMLRMLVEDGVLENGDGASLTAPPVPPTINALLSARLQRLAPRERMVVERAAVIGHQFPRDAVADLVGTPVDAELEALRRKELVRPDETAWLEDATYRFHHVLIRDAAYRSLLKEARAELHERFAVWLEVREPDQDAVIGFHLEQAFGYRVELGPLDGDARSLGVRAGDRLRAAGLRAMARGDLPAAANLLRRALAPLDGEHPLRLVILADLGEALVSAGDTAQAEWVVEELGLRAEECGDARLRARATALGGELANLAGGSPHDTLEVVSAAALQLAALGDDAGEARAHEVCAHAHELLGEVGPMEAALDRALAAARRAHDQRRVTAVLSGAPRAALCGPSPVVRASGRCLDVVRILRMSPGNRHVEAAALRYQAVLEAMRGRPEAARGILSGCRAVLEELGLTLELHETAVHAGMVEILAGDPSAAERWLRAARDGFAALGVDRGAAWASALLARALVDQGRDEEALAATVVAEGRGGGDRRTTIVWLCARARALARRGHRAQAVTLAERAVELAEPTDALADKAEAQMALAAALRAAGREDEARAATARAAELYAAKEHAVGVGWATGAMPARHEPVPPVGDVVISRAARLPIPEAVLEEERAWVRIVNARDWNELGARTAAEATLIDRREIGWEEVRGRDGVVDLSRQTVAMAPDVRVRNEALAGWHEGEVAIWAAICEYTGTEAEHGSRFQVRFGSVGIVRDHHTVLTETLPDDPTGVLARFDELVAEETCQAPAARAYRRFAAALNARDWPAIEARLHDDATLYDARTFAALDEARGREQVIAFLRGVLVSAADLRVEIDEVLAADDDATAMTGAWRRPGVAVRALAGPVEVAICWVSLFEGERLRRMEVFDVEQRERCLARYEELRGGTLHEGLVSDYAEAHYERCFADDVEVLDDRPDGWADLRGRRALLDHIEAPPRLTVLDATEDTVILGEQLEGEHLVSYNELRDGRIAWRINCESEERARAWARRRRSSQRIASGAWPPRTSSD